MIAEVSQFDYSPAVMMRFTNPFHAGVIANGANVVSATAGSRGGGASIGLWLKIEHGRVELARFRAYGCPHFIAAAEMLAGWCEGRAVSELSQWPWQAVEQALAMPASKRGRLLVLETALNSVINPLRTTQAAAG